MSHAYGNADDNESLKTIHHALDRGCRLLDTADEYGAGENERLLAKAIKGRRKGVFLATKFGFVSQNRGETLGLDGRPEYVAQACDASLSRLMTDHIDLYYLHRVDPAVPIEETVGAMATLVNQGKVLHLGLSEASPELIRRAHAVHPIAALQSEYSLWTRDPEHGALQTCRELDIGFVSFSPLGRGFFTGHLQRENLAANDFRQALPRFQDQNFNANLEVLSKLKSLANRKGCTSAQLALAWVLAQGDDVVAIPGTRSVVHLEENLAALEIALSASELRSMDGLLGADRFSGARYSEASVFRPKSADADQD